MGVVVLAFLAVVLVGQLTSDRGRAPLPAEEAAAPSPEASSSPSSSATPAEPTQAPAEFPFVKRQEGDPMAIGDVDAPVVLVQWTDMRCPFCAAFSTETLPQIVDEYVESGDVRLEVHDVSFFGEQSTEAAAAARAAAEQGRYFEYLHAVYDSAPAKGHPDLPREKLMAYAETAGVPDLDRFAVDLDAGKLQDAVAQSTQDAQQLGVSSVPFFVAGDTALAGAQPIEVFRAYLDDALSKAP